MRQREHARNGVLQETLYLEIQKVMLQYHQITTISFGLLVILTPLPLTTCPTKTMESTCSSSSTFNNAAAKL
jgi:hypothetical protein